MLTWRQLLVLLPLYDDPDSIASVSLDGNKIEIGTIAEVQAICAGRNREAKYPVILLVGEKHCYAERLNEDEEDRAVIELISFQPMTIARD